MDRWDDEWERHDDEQRKPFGSKRRKPPARPIPEREQELDGQLTWPGEKRRK
jgi:hypothetical protein